MEGTNNPQGVNLVNRCLDVNRRNAMQMCIAFLKTRIYLTDSGKVVRKPCRYSVTRERRKLKKQAKLLAQGFITFEQINNSYQSWRGSMRHRNARKTVHNMDLLFNKLFGEYINKERGTIC